jgi:hypothetical protein
VASSCRFRGELSVKPGNFSSPTIVFPGICGGVSMRTNPILLALPISLVSLAMAPKTFDIAEIGKQPIEISFPSGGSLRMDLCSSGVDIRGVQENIVRLSYKSENDTSEVRVRLRTSGSEGTLEVDRCPHENFRIVLEVPKLADLHVRMVAGQLDVKGITGNKDLELHFGQLGVEVGRKEDYAHVDASVTTGEVDGAPFEVSKGGLFRSFEREGAGKYRLHAHVGAGQVSFN